ncbi:MAG: hypothetical protein HN576_09520 [Bacteriovoracaceae bacterium]|jgi:hypothetical protein|nr:hypothetical protein [Bacteriovoracaceae bacterium]
MTLEQKEQFINLRGIDGKSFDAISKIMSVSKPTLIKWSKNLNIELNKLSDQRIIDLLDKYRFTKQAKIEIYGEIKERLLEEFSLRSLKTVPTEKLLVMILATEKEIPSAEKEEDSVTDIIFVDRADRDL